MRLLATFFFVLCALSTTLRAERAAITVFAAASLRGALDEIAADYGGPVQLSYGGSGTMARQVAAGAPADAVIFAHDDWMNWLETNSGIRLVARRALVTNQLVLVGRADTATSAQGSQVLALLGEDGRLAMGQRDAVPAGKYAREWLQNTGQWQGVASRLAETDNVRAALALVARGQAPVGIVYASDAAAEPAVRILAAIPPQTHSAIVYPAAALTPDGQIFLDHLGTAAAQATFVAHGFGAVAE